ncbi:MAG: hypothetical protein AAF772_07945, partial [Acidobacteriota bacterium]
ADAGQLCRSWQLDGWDALPPRGDDPAPLVLLPPVGMPAIALQALALYRGPLTVVGPWDDPDLPRVALAPWSHRPSAASAVDVPADRTLALALPPHAASPAGHLDAPFVRSFLQGPIAAARPWCLLHALPALRRWPAGIGPTRVTVTPLHTASSGAAAARQTVLAAALDVLLASAPAWGPWWSLPR